MSALSGARTSLSTRIYIWAGTMDLSDKGFSSVTMAQENPQRVPSRTKSSVPNAQHHKREFRASLCMLMLGHLVAWTTFLR